MNEEMRTYQQKRVDSLRRAIADMRKKRQESPSRIHQDFLGERIHAYERRLTKLEKDALYSSS